MAKNQAREFATMDEDKRRGFRGEGPSPGDISPGELDFGDPRDEERESRRAPRVRLGSAYQDGSANVGTLERLLSAAAGIAIIGYSYRSNRMRRLLVPLGTSLVARAVTGHCPVNRALGRNSAAREPASSPVTSVPRGQGIRVEEGVIVDRPAAELFAFWRDFENLPRFMEHLESVVALDRNRSHWIAKGPAGSRIEWDAEVHNEIPDELIAWRSLPGSEVSNAGSVHFRPVGAGDRTLVRVVLSYDPPAGRLGAVVARLFGEEPSQQVRDDLRRFREVMQAGRPGAENGFPGTA